MARITFFSMYHKYVCDDILGLVCGRVKQPQDFKPETSGMKPKVNVHFLPAAILFAFTLVCSHRENLHAYSLNNIRNVLSQIMTHPRGYVVTHLFKTVQTATIIWEKNILSQNVVKGCSSVVGEHDLGGHRVGLHACFSSVQFITLPFAYVDLFSSRMCDIKQALLKSVTTFCRISLSFLMISQMQQQHCFHCHPKSCRPYTTCYDMQDKSPSDMR